MQVETDFSHPLKLNCSSIASSTPGNNVSFPEGEFINFEEFSNQSQQKLHPNVGHKKRLTIQVNDSYDFNQNSMNHSEILVGVESAKTDQDEEHIGFFKKHEKNQEGLSYCIGESQSPSFANSNSEIEISKILSYNAFLEQKIKDLQNENNQFKICLNTQKSQIKVLKTENESLKITIKKKQEAISHEKERINKLTQKLAQFQQQKAQHAFYDEKLREKQAKNQQLQRKLQKISMMNKAFQKQLKQSDKKIMELQKQVQKNFCQNQQQTISRIKESSIKVKQVPAKSKELIPSKENKQNFNANTIANNMGNGLGSTIQMRKSIDKKKCSQSQGKKIKPSKPSELTVRAQRASSSSNIVAKKLLNLKKQ